VKKLLLKIKTIEFIDNRNQTYTITKNQVESFPLQGGEEADLITTKVWNQHGNTPVNVLMNAYEGELIFMVRTSNRTPNQIADLRREITDICNPLNGTIRMKITLNNDEVYSRDITFVNAPHFPVGLENRNKDWQKVQLLFVANNPFFYSEQEIFESFKGVEPVFTLPFEMSDTNPVVFGDVIPSNVAVNEGQVEAPVVIEIKGACTNPKITNETTGEFIGFKDLTMSTGETLVIETTFGRKRVELDGVNVFNKLDFSSTFFSLAKGENAIDFSDETGNTDATIHFRYKNLYITI
jgi:hypothetical protein